MKILSIVILVLILTVEVSGQTYNTDIQGTINATGYYLNGQPLGAGSQWTTSGTNIYFSNGIVSIGTPTAPSGYKLAVGGKIVAEEIVVKLQGNWPDYVFGPDYKLPPLEDLEKYIKEFRHLPGLPSASKMSMEGIALGYINKLLLEKIEELTLYLIQANNRVEELACEIENQQRIINGLLQDDK